MALGRGLAALIGAEARESAPGRPPDDQLVRVPVAAVRPNPEQPRRVFDARGIDDLRASIAEHGVLNPIVVRRDAEGWVLIAGERRLRAAHAAGLAEIPAIVRGRPADAPTQLELALIENLQRADLDPIEAALGYQRLIQRYGYSQEEVAKKVGKDRATVANALRLLKLPAAGRDALARGAISAGHARALLGLEDDALFARALATVLARELNVRATERLVAELKAEPRARREPDRGTERLARELTRAVGAKVAVRAKKAGGGRIVIDYHDAAELDRLVRILRA